MHRRRNQIETGARGEEIAAKFLESRGYRVVSRNYRCPGGEIDLVAWQGRTLVFVEVRTRRTQDVIAAAGSVGHQKQLRLLRAARHFMSHHELDFSETRFDVVVVVGTGEETHCEIVCDAFQDL